MSQIEKELSEKAAVLETLAPGASTSKDIESSIEVKSRAAQKLKDDIVFLQSRRSTVSDSIDKCKQEIGNYSGTAKKSTSVHIARAQSEQSNSSSLPAATSKKSKH